MNAEQLRQEWADMDRRHKAVLGTIAQNEERMDAVMRDLVEAYPDLEGVAPKDIPFDDLISKAEAKMETMAKRLEGEIATIKERIDNANRELVELG